MKRLAFAAVYCLAAARHHDLHAHGALPQEMPIARVLANLAERLQAKPDDAALHYRLGRAHALALEFKMESVFAWPQVGGDLELADRCWTRDRLMLDKDTKRPEATEKDLGAHLTGAIRHLNRALELDPSAPHVHLALASALEAGLPLAGGAEVFPRCPVPGARLEARGVRYLQDALRKFPSDAAAYATLEKALRSRSSPPGRSIPIPRDVVVTALHGLLPAGDVETRDAIFKLLLADWKESIAEEYFLAFSLALPHDSREAEKPIWESMDCWVTYEAAKEYLSIVEARGARDDEKVRVEVARAAVKAFDGLPFPSAITPIIFPGSGRATLASCLAPDTRVCFDLDGTGRDRAWPWVKPDTGILVWDPEHTGCITSGRELFGSVTWWLFFADGYQALAALDDDGDGAIDEAEIHGIGVWFDRDGDGVSDAGEVLPAEEFGIVRLAARSLEVVDGCPAHRAGMTLRDGRVLPTYDWITEPVSLAGGNVSR
jgi:hypothetical protein